MECDEESETIGMAPETLPGSRRRNAGQSELALTCLECQAIGESYWGSSAGLGG